MPPTTESMSKASVRHGQPLGGTALLREVERRSGATVSACFQCHKCSSGCPVGDDADFRSSQVLRLLHLGAGEEVLASRAIWLCSSCQACTARCPMGIDVASVMDTLRILAVERRAPLATTRDRTFARAFLASVRRHGRVFELGMLTAYKLSTLTFFHDLDKGLKMALTGKLRFWPRRSGSVREVRRVFGRARAEEKAR
jgi:heterodisulfide reductase subunit C2